MDLLLIMVVAAAGIPARTDSRTWLPVTTTQMPQWLQTHPWSTIPLPQLPGQQDQALRPADRPDIRAIRVWSTTLRRSMSDRLRTTILDLVPTEMFPRPYQLPTECNFITSHVMKDVNSVESVMMNRYYCWWFIF